MSFNKFDENQWTIDQPDQVQANTASSDIADSGLEQAIENTSVPIRTGSDYEKVQTGSNKHVSGYESLGVPLEDAGSSGGNSGGGATKKRKLFIALVCAVCIAAAIFGTLLVKRYTLTVNNGNGSGEYRAGDTVTIQAAPAKDGYTLTGWSVSDENVKRYRDGDRLIIKMPAEDFTVTAEYSETQYTLTVENGTIEDAGNSGSFTEGTQIAVHADSKDGFTFNKWEVTEGHVTINDASSQEAVVTIGSEDAVIQAVYTETKYTLLIKGGTLDRVKTSGSFTEGSKIRVLANSKKGYTFSKWEVIEGDVTFNDVSSRYAVVTIGSEDAVIQAVYTETQYTLSVKGGTIEGGKTSGSFTKGNKIGVRADSKDGYTFSKWEVTEGHVTINDASSQEAVVTIGSEDAVIQAVYTENKYTLSIIGGTIEGGKTSGNFTIGTRIKVHADSKDDYTFNKWKVTEGHVTLNDASSQDAVVTIGSEDAVIQTVYTISDKHIDEITEKVTGGPKRRESQNTVEILIPRVQ